VRVSWGVILAAAGVAVLAVFMFAHSCADADAARDRAEAAVVVAESQRRQAEAQRTTTVERLAQVTRDMIEVEGRARQIQSDALRRQAAAERQLEVAHAETVRLRKQLEKGREEVLALPPTEVAERLSAAYPGDVVPLPDGLGVQANQDGARAILADLQERVDLRLINASQDVEIKSCQIALDNSRAAGLGYMQEIDAVRRRLDAAALALDHTEASRVAAQAEIVALRNKPQPSRLKKYLIAFGAGAVATGVLLSR
jgi:chromosome segregation ATPase